MSHAFDVIENNIIKNWTNPDCPDCGGCTYIAHIPNDSVDVNFFDEHVEAKMCYECDDCGSTFSAKVRLNIDTPTVYDINE